MDFLTSVLLTPELLGALVALLGKILTVVVTRLAGALQAATGIKIDKRHREALHEAILSGAASAVQHGPTEAISTLRAHDVAHTKESVPEAIDHFLPPDTVLNRLADRYVGEAMSRLRPG